MEKPSFRVFTGRLSINAKILVLMAALMGLLTFAIGYWSAQTHQTQMRNELVEQARGFSMQMDAVWDFVDTNQDLINYMSDGSYEFKQLHCSVAAKAVAQLFTDNSGYTIRFVRNDPRNEADSPDEWEASALDAFEGAGHSEYYQLTDFDGELSLRYSAPLYVEAGCLECHGEPAGEMDVTGYPKEGWQVGDIAGATSIVIPAEDYVSAYNSALARDMVFYCAIMVVTMVVVFLALNRLATKPLHRLADALGRVRRTNIDIKLTDACYSSEMATVVKAFNEMTDELDDLYRNLERKVEERTRELSSLNEEILRQQEAIKVANQRLEQESAYKSEFLAVMSHELKTPLTAILASLETLKRPSSSLSDTDRKVATRGEANGRELLNMIDNVLQVGRSREFRQEAQWELIDLIDAVDYALDEVGPIVEERGIRLVRDVSPKTPLVYADWCALHRVLRNLLSNAIKYSRPEGTVTVSLEPRFPEPGPDSAADPDGAIIRVADDGIGISPDQIDGIFDRYFRAVHDSSTQPTGSGLGLYVVKESVGLLNGTIEVESAPGEGSAFIVTIPLNGHRREPHEDDPFD